MIKKSVVTGVLLLVVGLIITFLPETNILIIRIFPNTMIGIAVAIIGIVAITLAMIGMVTEIIEIVFERRRKNRS